jgi:serine/threonine protein kinase
MPPRPGTAPDTRAIDAVHAEAACAACGVVLEAPLRSGEIVDVYRGHLRETPPIAVAVKLTRARWRGHPGAIRLIAREHRVLAAVDHAHVVRARCFAERDGVAVLATDYLSGGDLVPLAGAPPARWVPAARQVVAALEALHAADWVHGDVKARNVMVDANGRAKLIDLGSARRFGEARSKGGRTRAHEPLRFELPSASPAEDVYALAVLLYELLTGRLPFGPDPVAWTRPAPVERARSRGVETLAARVIATLEAAAPRDVGTLIEFADVLESVHGEAVAPV